jgi:hypothetical protein
MEVQQIVPLKPQPQFVTLREIILSLFPTLNDLKRYLYVSEDALNMKVRRELFDAVKMLFNNDKKMVERLAKEHFVDEMHATYFMEYVYRFRKAINRLIFAPHYLGIILYATREDERGRKIDRIRRYYVIGINDYSDGLFINELSTLSAIVFKVITYANITIDASTDEDFRKFFDYDKDVLEQEAVLTVEYDNSAIRYRVSGEVVFSLSEVDLTSLFDEQVQRYIAYLTADKLMRILIDHGFNPDPNVRFEGSQVAIRLPGTLSGKLASWKRDETDKERVVKAFASMIEKYFTIQYMETGERSIIISDETAMVVVDFLLNLREMRRSRGDLQLWIRVGEIYKDSPTYRTYNEMMSDIINSIRDMLNNSERVDELMIGNHYIRIEHGLPINFVYEPKIRPKLLDPLLITVYRPRTFLVTPRTKVTVEHAQHGSRHISFDGTYALEITTTNISDEYLEKVNVLALRKLLKQMEQ